MLARMLTTILLFLCVFQSMQVDEVVPLVVHMTVKKNTLSPLTVDQTYRLQPYVYSAQLSNMNHQGVTIVKADPFDACQQLKIPALNFQNQIVFYLIDGSTENCGIRRKIAMAREGFARGVIIVGDINGTRSFGIDDPTFVALIMSVSIGQQFNASRQFNAELAVRKSIADSNSIQIWISSLNRQSYELLHWWNETLRDVQTLRDVKWKPRFVFYGCYKPQDVDQEYINTDQHICKNEEIASCACLGEFCSPQFHESSPQVLIQEDYRQKYIFQKYPNKFMNYINYFQDQCLKNYIQSKYSSYCSNSVLSSMGLPTIDIDSDLSQFLKNCDFDQRMYGELLADKRRFTQINTYPAFVLNHEQLYFSGKDELQSQLCRKLSIQDAQGCVQIVSKRTILSTIVSIFFFIVIIAGLVGAGAVAVICYKNRLRREMNKQITMQVSTAVEHYFALSQTK